MSESANPRALRQAGVVFAWVVAAFLIALVFLAGWVGVRGFLASQHLIDAQATATAVREDLTDPALASAAIADVAADTAAARALTSDPLWQVAEALPWAGPQLSAVSTVAAAVDDVAGSALAPLADVASGFDLAALRPQDGRIDLAPFTDIREAAATGAASIGGAAEAVAAIDRAPLIRPLREAVDEVGALLDETETATGALTRAATLLPAMLGADGPRSYLVLFQNNAEWRSLGGIPGATALVRTDGGAISLAEQASSSDFPRYDESVLPLGSDVEGIFSARPGRFIQNVTQIPDFAVSGALAREMWARERGGEQVDGVIAIDPVALSYLLAATGPVTLPTGDVITAENAVPLLLNEVYFRYEDPADQDAFFAAAAASVFSALTAGGTDPTALVDALTRAGDERRLLLWSAREDEQTLLDGTSLAGPLPETDDDIARFGVYLNDGTGSKMDYYVSATPTLTWDSCVTGGSAASPTASGTATLTVTLTNNAPADAATSLPRYITGGGAFDVDPGIARTVGYVYLPEGFELQDATITGDVGFGGGTHDGRRVLSFAVDVAPGASATATVTVTAPEGSAPQLELVSTPTLVSPPDLVAVCEPA
ncbi:DUF4012 domain-containing protein [Microbacterium sp. ABRD28]|uniref:DUF4012 domain-containing protein n=1 Tax=Microbacterium sp. ABRD28 TaxID=2268461 RepID=UPI000F557998|nr:DUF4012 domain-containing protein [Microbacterium sp. ABRD28]AZC12447.1 DUF4012 domain-containing protein [Microbacterium sp. ABRD28]